MNVPHARLVSKKRHPVRVMIKRRAVSMSTNVLKPPVSAPSELTAPTLKDHTLVKLVTKLARNVSVLAMLTVLSVSRGQL
jgi:hypothetical protein